jgi:uncharacterized protein YaiE (UPF0345 family)
MTDAVKAGENQISVIEMESTAQFKTELNPESISRATAHKYRKMVDTVKSQVVEDLAAAEKAVREAVKLRDAAIETMVKKFRSKTGDKRIAAASKLAKVLQEARQLTDKQKFEVNYDTSVDEEKKTINVSISVGKLNADRSHYNYSAHEIFSVSATLKFDTKVKETIKGIEACDEHLRDVRKQNQVVLEMLAQQSMVCEEVNMQLVDLFLSGGGVTHEDIKQAMVTAAKDILAPKLKQLPQHVSQLMLPATKK